MSEFTDDENRFLCRYWHQKQPEWSARRVGKEVGIKNHQVVLRWWERRDTRNLKRGNTVTHTKVNANLKRKVKKMMVGTKQGEGGMRLRKESIRTTKKRLREEEKIDVSYGTVQKVVNKLATYRVRAKKVRLNENYAGRRWKWADDHVSWTNEWDSFLNSDSSPFYVEYASNRKNDGVWCEGDDEPEPIPEDKYALKTEVYIGCCRRGMTPPVFIDSPARVNAQNYVGEVLPTMARDVSKRKKKTNDPTTTRLFTSVKKWTFQQDLARPHIARHTQQYLKDNVPAFWTPDETPPKLFEWPIEQLWNELQRRVYSRGRPRDLKQLKKWITAECKDPSWFEWLTNVWDSFPRRVQDICEAEGWWTDN